MILSTGNLVRDLSRNFVGFERLRADARKALRRLSECVKVWLTCIPEFNSRHYIKLKRKKLQAFSIFDA